MKFEEFDLYKKIVESGNEAMFEKYPEALKVKAWMEESGRIDEGILSGVWSWIKKNFSIKARKIHSLAEEYAKELLEEGRAEFAKTKEPKDLLAKYRAGNYNRLSRDIEERMDVIAADDEDYRELVRTLVNKKNLEIKKSLIRELKGKYDPSDYKKYGFSKYERELDAEILKADVEYNKKLEALTNTKKSQYEKILRYITQKFGSLKLGDNIKNEMGLDTLTKQKDFISIVSVYVNELSDMHSSIDFNEKTVYDTIEEIYDVFDDIIKDHGDKHNHHRIAKIFLRNVEKHLKSDKPQKFDVLSKKLKDDVVEGLEEKD